MHKSLLLFAFAAVVVAACGHHGGDASSSTAPVAGKTQALDGTAADEAEVLLSPSEVGEPAEEAVEEMASAGEPPDPADTDNEDENPNGVNGVRPERPEPPPDDFDGPDESAIPMQALDADEPKLDSVLDPDNQFPPPP